MAPPDFARNIIDNLSRRAALRCSNPDCDKLTTGPNLVDSKATNIGEAAHIYGARPGAARYRPEMSDDERASISNAIWLCSDCHGQIDKDAGRFPENLLLIWKEKHEEKLMQEIGKPGELLRRLANDREIGQLGSIPLYAEQIIREKPPYWEYMLTAELLDYHLKPVLRAARDLELGLSVRPRIHLPRGEFFLWMGTKPADLRAFIQALEGLLEEFRNAWGAPGQPGDAELISHVAQLVGRAARHMVEVAEEAKFTNVPEGFEGLADCLVDGALHPIKNLPELSKFIRSIFHSTSNPSSNFEYVLKIEMPEGWTERFRRELAKGQAALEARGGEW
ncbi:hypothetical protein QE435_003128 [Rhizobium sp. SORGH_AS 787]|nr:hypothetical protein [Rhizobium sp. SORGH_AS_0787]